MGRPVAEDGEPAVEVEARRWLHGASFCVLTTRDDEPSQRRSAKARRMVFRAWLDGELAGDVPSAVARVRSELAGFGFARALELADARSREPGSTIRPGVAQLSALAGLRT